MIFLVWGALWLSGCAYNRPDNTSQPVPHDTPAAKQPAPETKVVLRDSGWQIPGLKGHKALKRTEIKGAEAAAPKMHFTQYELAAAKGEPYVIQRSFFSEDERRALRLLPYDLVVTDLWAYDVEGRKYCYMLRGHPPDIGALQTVRFCDKDGDGTFEAAESVKYVGIVPGPPNWSRGEAKLE